MGMKLIKIKLKGLRNEKKNEKKTAQSKNLKPFIIKKVLIKFLKK